MSRIQIQADDFFNAYLVLKVNNEAVIERLSKLPGTPLVGTKELGTHPTPGIEIVCLAFSLELYLKDLHYALTKKKPSKDHDILKLFNKLPEKIRQEIFACDSISQNPFIARGNIFYAKRSAATHNPYDGFIDHIKEISDGFVKWRYSYESSTLRYSDSFAVAFIHAIKSVTDNVRRQNPLP